MEEVLQFVLLTCGAGTHEVLDEAAHVGKVKILTKTMQGALHPLVAILMDRGHDLLK